MLNGQVVHAVKGQRTHYLPLESVLCNSHDPLIVAKTFRDRLGLNEIYIADLDAIQGYGQIRHREVIENLACEEKMNLILDAGVSDVDSIHTLFDIGVRKVIVGSETLRLWTSVQEIPSKTDRGRLVFSLDMRSGKILSQCPAFSDMPPMKALEHLRFAGWQEILLLDLKRVGSREGVDRSLVSDVKTHFPDLDLLVGGGISNIEDLVELETMGVAGVLAATAFHNGTIMARHICNFGTARL